MGGFLTFPAKIQLSRSRTRSCSFWLSPAVAGIQTEEELCIRTEGEAWGRKPAAADSVCWAACPDSALNRRQAGVFIRAIKACQASGRLKGFDAKLCRVGIAADEMELRQESKPQP